jgi:hypothetical protein
MQQTRTAFAVIILQTKVIVIVEELGCIERYQREYQQPQSYM